MNMYFNIFEIANVLLVAFLLWIVTRKRDVTTLLLVLFVYGTLHFGFAAITLTSSNSAQLLIALHIEGGGVLAKLSTLLLLTVVFMLLGKIAYEEILLGDRNERKIVIHFVLVMTALLFGYISSYRGGDWLQLKNFISIEVMLALVLIGYLAVNHSHSLNPVRFYPWWIGGLFVLGFTDSIAIYEVFDHQSWAGTMQSSGDMVYRASSILFNPNLLAYWASLVYLGCAYGVYAYRLHRNMMFFGMILASVAIYFSGSRSASYLLLIVLFIPALLIRGRFHWLPLLVLPVTMFAIYAGATWVACLFVVHNDGWHEITLLGLRFYAALPSLVAYLIGKGAPVEIIDSIEGRFVGEGRDSGWVVLYQDMGWLGMAALIWSACVLIVWGVRAYAAQPNVTSIYALTTLIYCLLTGIVMRFQIFPVWLFTSLALIQCMVYWRQIKLPSWRKML